MKNDRTPHDVVGDLERRGALPFLPTGLASLDHLIGGICAGDVFVIAARPSKGKTSMGLDFSRRACERGTEVGFISLEMSAESLVQRLVAGYTGVDMNKLRFGGMTEAEEDLVKETCQALAPMPLFINDSGGMDGPDFEKKLGEWYEAGVGLAVVDYVQLMGGQGESRQFEVSAAMRAIKRAARTTGVPVLCLAQLSRAAEQRDGPPRLSDLRDSGEIENSADQVMFIHPQGDTVDLIIAKNRNGPCGAVTVRYDPVRMRFCDLTEGATE